METAGCIPNAWKSMFLPVELKGDHEKRRQPMPVAPLSIADRLMASDHAVSASQPVSLRADAKAGPRVCTVFAAASTAERADSLNASGDWRSFGCCAIRGAAAEAPSHPPASLGFWGGPV